MKVIILAGGKGSRLPHSAKDKPKCLIEINGKPILRHQLEFLAMHGLIDVRLSLGFRAEQVIEYLEMFHPSPFPSVSRRAPLENVSRETFSGRGETFIDYVIENKPLGTGGAIKFASHDLKDNFMVLNGDIFTNANLKDFIKQHEQLVRQKGILGSILAVRLPDARDFGLIKHKDGLITEFLEKPTQKMAGHINGGVYILNPKIFKNGSNGSPQDVSRRAPLENVSRETFSGRGETSCGEPFGTELTAEVSVEPFSVEHDIFPDLAKQARLGVYLHSGNWTDLGTEERLKKQICIEKVRKPQ